MCDGKGEVSKHHKDVSMKGLEGVVTVLVNWWKGINKYKNFRRSI